MPNQITKSIIVKGDISEIYGLWANFEKFPFFMSNIKSVIATGNKSRWTMEGPMGKDFEWEAETTRLEPDKRIAWKTLKGDLKVSGQVTFNELPNEEVEITLSWNTCRQRARRVK